MKAILLCALSMLLFSVSAQAAGYAASLSVPGELVVAVTQNVVNDADSGMNGYWATDEYNKLTLITKLDTDVYAAIVQYVGRFETYAGAPSPVSGALQTEDASGKFVGVYYAIFNSSGCAPQKGKLPTEDRGVTKEEILAQTPQENGLIASISQHCANVHDFAIMNYAFRYQLGNQTMMQKDGEIIGDIVS